MQQTSLWLSTPGPCFANVLILYASELGFRWLPRRQQRTQGESSGMVLICTTPMCSCCPNVICRGGRDSFYMDLGKKIYSIYRNSKTRWFQNFFIFIPIPGEMIHVIRAYFSDGDSFNHQAENSGHFSLDLLQINSHLGLPICLELKMSDLLCCRGPGAEAGGGVFEFM